MKNDAQRTAIAEACGWKKNEDGVWILPWKSTHISALDKELPDYLNDLNAMHEAEKVMTRTQSYSYHGELMKFFEPCVPDNNAAAYPWHATAAQRAEAFLRTLGLWLEW